MTCGKHYIFSIFFSSKLFWKYIGKAYDLNDSVIKTVYSQPLAQCMGIIIAMLDLYSDPDPYDPLSDPLDPYSDPDAGGENCH